MIGILGMELQQLAQMKELELADWERTESRPQRGPWTGLAGTQRSPQTVALAAVRGMKESRPRRVRTLRELLGRLQIRSPEQ